MAFLRPAAALVAGVLLALTGHIGTASAASDAGRPLLAAGKGYTYWGFYVWKDQKSTWEYMTVGANDPKHLPKDGDVYGFRWALVVKQPRLPRAGGDFSAICRDHRPGGGSKRVGFVIDYGTDADAADGDDTPEPRGACAVVDDSFTVQQALQTVAQIRTGNGGLICAVDGYPSKGCGDVVKNADEPAADQRVTLSMPGDESDSAADSSSTASDNGSDDSGPPWTIAIAAVAAVALAAGAFVLHRRQS